MKIRVLLIIAALLFLVHARPASATACTNNAYGTHITCINQTSFIGDTAGCNTSHAKTLAVTAGDRIVVWSDSGGSFTSVPTDSDSNTYLALTDGTHSLANTSALGGGTFELAASTVAAHSVTLTFTQHCSGANYELLAFSLRSSVGTVGIDCTSNWVNLASSPSGTAVSASCTAAAGNEVAISLVDFGNAQPVIQTPLIAMTDNSSTEDAGGIASVSGAGSFTGSWKTNGTDVLVTGLAVFNDGGTVGHPAGQFPRVN